MLTRGSAFWEVVSIPALLVIAVLAWSVSTGKASAADAFSQGGIHVDETADTAEAARSLAHEAGARAAFARLLHRILLERDVRRVPVEIREDPSRFVAGFSIHGERIAPKRYRARMEVQFDAPAVRELLEDLDIGYEEKQFPLQLVIPVLQQDGAVSLWDDNSWLNAWVRRSSEAGFPSFQLPHGEAGDVVTLSAEDAVAGERERIALLGSRYAIDHATVAIASPLARARPPAIDLEIRILRGGRLIEQEHPFRLVAAADEKPRELLDRAISATIRVANDLWVASEQARRVVGGSIEVRAEYGSFREWRAIRKILTESEWIVTYAVQRLALNESELRFDYRDSPDTLRNALNEAGLEIADTSGRWVVSLPQVPVPAPILTKEQEQLPEEFSREPDLPVVE